MFGSGPRARFGSSLRLLWGLSTSRTPAATARMTLRHTQACTIISSSFLWGVTSEQLIMACGRHEKEHRERKNEIRPRCQKGYPGMFRHLRRRRGLVRGGLRGHPDHDFLIRPDQKPHVEEHDDPEPSPNSNRDPPRSRKNPMTMAVREMRPHDDQP